MLSFGPWAPGYINPLDGDLVVTDKRKPFFAYCHCNEMNSQVV